MRYEGGAAAVQSGRSLALEQQNLAAQLWRNPGLLFGHIPERNVERDDLFHGEYLLQIETVNFQGRAATLPFD